MRKVKMLGLVAFVGLFAGCAQDLPTNAMDPGAPSFAHESNNAAELTGTQNGNSISGTAIINAIVNRGAVAGWRSTVNVRGLAAGDYTFEVNLNGAMQTVVCSFTVRDRGGRQGCSSDTNVPGFNTGQIRDSSGTVVASGTFERRGGDRFDP